MKTRDQGKIEYWRGHVAGAESFERGVGAYCQTQGLKLSTYYGWRRILQKGARSPRSLKPPRSLEKNQQSFVPMKILCEGDRRGSPAFAPTVRPTLPDARWVAEILTHLVRGCS